MSGLLPRSSSPRPVVKPGLPGIAASDRYDAILVLLPTDAAPDRSLPSAARWVALHQRGAHAHGAVRATTLDNARGTLAVIGYCRADADAFERLRVSGLIAQKLLAERPQPARLALVAQVSARERANWQEALCSAVLAHTFALPSARQAEKSKPLAAIDIFGASTLDTRRLAITADATNLVRHLVALPPNQLDAGGYRTLLGRLARDHGLRLRWYDERALAKLGAGAFLAVSRGNARRDAGIAHLSWSPPPRSSKRDAAPDISLVGKGVLFDTGGTNLKPHRSMLDMHTDMAGSAVALAALVALARLKTPLRAEAWLAITENSIGPAAYRPQEVIRALNGTSIQIIHSDAEGRLILADTLTLAARRKPRLMVDFATLTGACVYALTERMSGVFANDEPLGDALLAAGRSSGERLWPFPMPGDFDTDIESTVADVAQCALEGKGDHILAARFLQRFVPQGTRWAHIDLSSATRKGGLAHVPTEITGFGARAALSLLLDHLPQ
jgi:leucyl aminopeptidase